MRRHVRLTAVLIVAIVAIVAGGGDLSAQCAMCRRALESPEGRQMIAAFRGGILLLLAAPFAVFGTVAAFAMRLFRRKVDEPPDDRG